MLQEHPVAAFDFAGLALEADPHDLAPLAGHLEDARVHDQVAGRLEQVAAVFLAPAHHFDLDPHFFLVRIAERERRGRAFGRQVEAHRRDIEPRRPCKPCQARQHRQREDERQPAADRTACSRHRLLLVAQRERDAVGVVRGRRRGVLAGGNRAVHREGLRVARADIAGRGAAVVPVDGMRAVLVEAVVQGVVAGAGGGAGHLAGRDRGAAAAALAEADRVGRARGAGDLEGGGAARRAGIVGRVRAEGQGTGRGHRAGAQHGRGHLEESRGGTGLDGLRKQQQAHRQAQCDTQAPASGAARKALGENGHGHSLLVHASIQAMAECQRLPTPMIAESFTFRVFNSIRELLREGMPLRVSVLRHSFVL
ncbi:hypothetical protein VARIO8X_50220 [Burkholderiales bacterium 8X]|nr:hypothetical protein VARIO8X_50220 [Burkholderiales bacterium 8X]